MFILLSVTGCRQDDMEDIDIIVTNYPNEYIVSQLYGKHSNISSIYPDGVDIDNYKITNKRKKDISKKALFVYTGLIEKERKIAVDLLDINGGLKIIDTSYVLETQNSIEELWLNPSYLLMMAKNVELGLNEYISSSYLKKEIKENYEKLKEYGFGYPYKAYLVNFEYISAFKKNEIILVNNDVIPLSRHYKKEFDQKYNDFLQEML